MEIQQGEKAEEADFRLFPRVLKAVLGCFRVLKIAKNERLTHVKSMRSLLAITSINRIKVISAISSEE